ncbi:MAG: FAD-dependent oxidoreductase, partial [Anaerovorax sp.]
ISFTATTKPTAYNLPIKKKKIAVIGAGISGLACALRLATKKYEVEILEKSDRIGGSLWSLMDSKVFLPDIEEQFQFETYALHLNREIKNREELEQGGYDAVYVATGKGGESFGLHLAVNEKGHEYCQKHGETGWFAGGGVIGREPIEALADGLFMGTMVDNFLKTGNLNYENRKRQTGMCASPEKILYEKPVIPSQRAENGTFLFSKEEAQQEALRCIECQCDACRIHCDLTDFYNKWPLRIRDEVMATTLPGSAEVKATPAKRLMSTCNQCGLCKETCPEEIDLGGLILAGRKSMHKQKKAPWVFHDFWMRDMNFANSELCALVKMPRGQTKCDYAFFPGCQLGAGEPKLVESTYAALLEKNPEMGILLKCCGVPGEWAGQEEAHKKELEHVRADWISLGKPTLIVACPTCEKKIKEYLREIPVSSLYEILEKWGIEGQSTEVEQIDGDRYEIFHPCSA